MTFISQAGSSVGETGADLPERKFSYCITCKRTWKYIEGRNKCYKCGAPGARPLFHHLAELQKQDVAFFLGFSGVHRLEMRSSSVRRHDLVLLDWILYLNA